MTTSPEMNSLVSCYYRATIVYDAHLWGASPVSGKWVGLLKKRKSWNARTSSSSKQDSANISLVYATRFELSPVVSLFRLIFFVSFGEKDTFERPRLSPAIEPAATFLIEDGDDARFDNFNNRGRQLLSHLSEEHVSPLPKQDLCDWR